MTAETIRQFREAMGWSQQALAESIPVARFSVIRWEAGRVRPHPAFAARISELMKAHGYTAQSGSRTAH